MNLKESEALPEASSEPTSEASLSEALIRRSNSQEQLAAQSETFSKSKFEAQAPVQHGWINRFPDAKFVKRLNRS